MKKSLKALPLLAVAGLSLSAVSPVFAQSGDITIVSREEASGTRGAFVEIVGVVDENGDDFTTFDATIQNGTNAVMQTVAGDQQSIGYISLGSLDDSIKALNVDGAEATAENVTNGSYPIARPFLIAWQKDADLSETAADFLDFIHSQEGQTIVEEEGYVAVDVSGEQAEEAPAEEEATEESTEEESTEESTEESATETEEAGSVIDSLPVYEATDGLSGQIEVNGSTSVTPVLEVLAEAYKVHNPEVEININSTGSSAGITAAIDGIADLGMSSRDLTEEETEVLEYDAIAMDGIAVIVNNENTLEDISLEAIKSIYLGEALTWEEAQ